MGLRIIAVAAVALAAGHVVQTLRPAPAHIAQSASVVEPAPADMPKLAGITSVSATTSGGDTGCAPRLSLAAAPGALIDVALSAPCNPGEQVIFRHAGLAFSETVDAKGNVRAFVPAMTGDAQVAAYVGSSEIVLGRISVPDAGEFLRVAVHMSDAAEFDLRAEEGDEVFVAQSAGLDGAVHRITRLGQERSGESLVSQVYSVALQDLDAAELTVELRVTPEICGKTIVAEVVTSRLGKTVQESHNVAVPLCGTSGDILQLKNLLPDLTLKSPV